MMMGGGENTASIHSEKLRLKDGTGSGTSNTIEAAAATPAPSLPSVGRGGGIVTPTIRDGGGGRGGEVDYYMMMGGGEDTALIHSEKSRLKDQPS